MLNDFKKFITILWRFAHNRFVLMLVLSILVMLLEGSLFAFLLPLLRMLGLPGDEQFGKLEVFVHAFFKELNLEFSLGPVLVVMVILSTFQYSLFIIQAWISARLQSDIIEHLQRQLFDAVMHAGWKFFVRSRAGDLSSVAINETVRIGGIINLMNNAVGSFFQLIVYAALALMVSWEVTAWLLLASGLIALICIPILYHARTVGQRITSAAAQFYGWTHEAISGAKLIKATGAESLACDRFGDIAQVYRKANFWSTFHPGLIRAAFESTAIIFLLLALYISVNILGTGIAEVIVVVVLFVRLIPRITTVQQMLQTITVQLPAVENYERRLADARADAESELADSDVLFQGPPELKLQKVVVSYGEGVVLDKIDLFLPKGKIVGIAGPSGAGKTTLLDCLLRLIEIQDGRILVNENDLSSLPLGAWRRSIGYVTQDTILFNASVRDNIVWSNPNADRSALEAAARQAHAHDFICDMPDGYDTNVGDHGVRLSGGQRQRLGLARALFGGKTFLILDEATSALDQESEETVLKAVRELRGNVTVVMVAHRLSTLRFADLIYYVENGCLLESGSWTELTGQNGSFAKMWKLQNSV